METSSQIYGMLEETSRGNFLEFLPPFAGGHICDHIRAELGPAAAGSLANNVSTAPCPSFQERLGQKSVRHSVWCFSQMVGSLAQEISIWSCLPGDECCY